MGVCRLAKVSNKQLAKVKLAMKTIGRRHNNRKHNSQVSG